MPEAKTTIKWVAAGSVLVVMALLVPFWLWMGVVVGSVAIFVVLCIVLVGIMTVMAGIGFLPVLLVLIWMFVSHVFFEFESHYPEIELIDWPAKNSQFASILSESVPTGKT